MIAVTIIVLTFVAFISFVGGAIELRKHRRYKNSTIALLEDASTRVEAGVKWAARLEETVALSFELLASQRENINHNNRTIDAHVEQTARYEQAIKDLEAAYANQSNTLEAQRAHMNELTHENVTLRNQIAGYRQKLESMEITLAIAQGRVEMQSPYAKGEDL